MLGVYNYSHMSFELPNLSTDFCGGIDTSTGETYDSQKECSAKRHIPEEILKLARKNISTEDRKQFGLLTNGSIKWLLFQPWLSAHYSELQETLRVKKAEEFGDGRREKLELEKLKEQVTELRNRNKANNDTYIDRRITINTLKRIYGVLFANLSRYLEFEQPAKCDGMTANQLKAANVEFRNRLFNDLKNQLGRWENKEDLSETKSEDKPDGQIPNRE